MQHQPIWEQTTPKPPNFPSLDRDLAVEYLIIGSGITGITTAYLLHRAGIKATVIEGNEQIGGYDTHRTSGHLSLVTDLEFKRIIDRQGEEAAQVVAESLRAAIDQVQQIAEREGLDINFRRVPGYLYAEEEKNVSDTEDEYDATRQAGLQAEWAEVPVPFPVAKGFKVADNAVFHPLRYVYGLAEVLKREGVDIYTDTRAMQLKSEDGKHKFPTSTSHSITAEKVILATHLPAFLKTEQSTLLPSKSYVLAAKLDEEVPDALLWDMQEPYNYARPGTLNGETVLIVGGKDHRTGEERDTESHYDQLERYTREHYAVREIALRWSGQWYEPSDSLPLIGPSVSDDTIYVASGYSGDGMVYSQVAARVLTNLITGQSDQAAEHFKPRRFPLSTDYVKNAATMAEHYIKDWLPTDHPDVDSIEPGSGKLINHNLEKFAVYRDDSGELHAMSAKCTHMGCVVQWNNAEQTWDCPCHGGQFSCKGEALRSPVTKPLAQKQVSKIVDK